MSNRIPNMRNKDGVCKRCKCAIDIWPTNNMHDGKHIWRMACDCSGPEGWGVFEDNLIRYLPQYSEDWFEDEEYAEADYQRELLILQEEIKILNEKTKLTTEEIRKFIDT